jgi:hypothetical protein
MNRKITPTRLFAAVLFALLPVFVMVSITRPTPTLAAAQSETTTADTRSGGPDTWPLPVTFRAFAVDMSGTTARTQSGTLEITVERWSSDQERAALKDALVERGSDKLLGSLQSMPRVGYIRTTSSVGWDLHYASATPIASGGTRVAVATDRPMAFYELWNRPRSAEYEFTLAEMRIGPDGKGEGKLVPAAKINYDQDTRTIEIEDYGIEPVRLTQIEAIPGKKATSR